MYLEHIVTFINHEEFNSLTEAIWHALSQESVEAALCDIFGRSEIGEQLEEYKGTKTIKRACHFSN